VNDTYGHLVGDGVLQQLSRLLVSSFRLEDIVCEMVEKIHHCDANTTIEPLFPG
jgi:hypothetical protein